MHQEISELTKLHIQRMWQTAHKFIRQLAHGSDSKQQTQAIYVASYVLLSFALLRFFLVFFLLLFVFLFSIFLLALFLLLPNTSQHCHIQSQPTVCSRVWEFTLWSVRILGFCPIIQYLHTVVLIKMWTHILNKQPMGCDAQLTLTEKLYKQGDLQTKQTRPDWPRFWFVIRVHQ